MTDPTPAPNGFRAALGILGLIAIVLGGILALIGNANGQKAVDVNQLATALGVGSDSAGAADFALMWFGIVLAILGAVMCILWIAIKALQSAR